MSDPFAPISLFATPLFSTALADAEKHKSELVREILLLQSKHPGTRKSNYNAWHSEDELPLLRSEHVAWVLEKATKYARTALAPYYGQWAHQELKLGKYWANVLGRNGWNTPHHHFPTHWSGVYYISVGKVAGTKEDMGGMIEFLNPTPWQSLWNRGGNFAIAPKDGTMLIFPATIQHFVYPHASDEPRISIAFNFNVVPKP